MRLRLILLSAAIACCAAQSDNLKQAFEEAGRHLQAGDLQAAEKRGMDALRFAENEGVESVPYGRTANLLGTVFHHQARFVEAEAWFRASLRALEASEGPDHPEIANVLNNLGVTSRFLAPPVSSTSCSAGHRSSLISPF